MEIRFFVSCEIERTSGTLPEEKLRSSFNQYGCANAVESAVHRYRVCVADDNVETAYVLSQGLSLHSYDVATVHSGEEAIQVCQGGDIDLILLDVAMPGMDGYKVCQCLKECAGTRDIVVIFITVKGSKEDISKGFSLGAADYITKPFNLPMVMLRVDAAMRRIEAATSVKPRNGIVVDATYTDPLTGLRSGAYLLQRLQEEVEKAHRYDYPVSCAVFDIDEVQALDPKAGPAPLDDLLAEIAITLRNHSRTFDVVARYDGTLFAAILPHTPLEDATRYARKILNEIRITTFSDPNFPTEATLSVGIVSFHNGSACGADLVLGEAMRGLLQARSLPKENRIVARDLVDR